MTREETAKLLALIGAAHPRAAKELPAGSALQATVLAWTELLSDLDYPTAKAATLRVLREMDFPGLPAPGLIAQAAAELARPRDPDPDEAWALVAAAMRRFGWMDPHGAYATLPPLVVEVARGIGWRALCEGTTDIMRGQFRRAYETALARTRQQAALPPALQDGALALPAPRERPALAAVVDLGTIGRRVP